MTGDGGRCVETDPDKKVVGFFECAAPGPISRLGQWRCDGNPCGWLWRLPGYDLIDNAHNTARFGFKTNSSDSMTITMTYYYNEVKQQCTANCTPPPPLRVITTTVGQQKVR